MTTSTIQLVKRVTIILGLISALLTCGFYGLKFYHELTAPIAPTVVQGTPMQQGKQTVTYQFTINREVVVDKGK